MNKNYVPTPQDEALRMETAKTVTSTGNGTALDMGAGFAAGGIGKPAAVVVSVTAGDNTTGDETYAFKVQDSPDNSTWTDISPTITSLLTTSTNLTARAYSIGCFVSQRYVRLQPTLGGTTPSVTYDAWLNANVVP